MPLGVCSLELCSGRWEGGRGGGEAVEQKKLPLKTNESCIKRSPQTELKWDSRVPRVASGKWQVAAAVGFLRRLPICSKFSDNHAHWMSITAEVRWTNTYTLCTFDYPLQNLEVHQEERLKKAKKQSSDCTLVPFCLSQLGKHAALGALVRHTRRSALGSQL